MKYSAFLILSTVMSAAFASDKPAVVARHDTDVQDIVYLAKNELLVTLSSRGVSVTDLKLTRDKYTIAADKDEDGRVSTFRAVAVSPGEGSLFLSSIRWRRIIGVGMLPFGRVKEYELPTGKLLGEVLLEENCPVITSISVSDSGKYLALGTGPHTLNEKQVGKHSSCMLIDLTTKKVAHSEDAGESEVVSVKFLQKDRLLLFSASKRFPANDATPNGQLVLVDLQTFKRAQSAPSSATTASLSFDAAAQHILVGGARLVKEELGFEVNLLKDGKLDKSQAVYAGSGVLRSVAFAHDGKSVLVGEGESTNSKYALYRIDIQTGKKVADLSNQLESPPSAVIDIPSRGLYVASGRTVTLIPNLK